MGKKEAVPTVSRTVMMPDPMNGHAMKRAKRVSIASSVNSDVSSDNGEAPNDNVDTLPRNKSKLRRCRKRLSTLLHTHVILILVCTLAALDAVCVIGQIICDILIMKETLHEWESLDDDLTSLLWKELPALNTSDHDGPGSLNLELIRNILERVQRSPHTNLTALADQLAASGIVVPASASFDPSWLRALQDAAASALHTEAQASPGSVNVSMVQAPVVHNATVGEMIIGFFKIPVAHSRSRRSAGGADEEHSLLYDFTHSFHLGSMIILSMLLLETLLKVFAMGRKVLHHKLEIFDAFVVSVSWALDVAFWEGIWAHPGSEAATILIFILPWRVVRIVNSFVLVIQEKDHVQLKIVKQRLRLSVKKSKESTRKASSYRTEVKYLQGLCRKYGATENEISACGPTGRTGRRRSSLLPAMERAASLTLISALGSHPSLYTMGSSSDEDDATSRDLTRKVSQDPTLRSAFSVSTLDSVFTIEGGKSLGDGYLTSDTEDNESSALGVDHPAFSPADPLAKDDPSELSAVRLGDAESGGRLQLVHRLHERLSEKPSIVSVLSETSTSSGSGAGTDPAAQDVPPHYHEVISKQDSNTRL